MKKIRTRAAAGLGIVMGLLVCTSLWAQPAPTNPGPTAPISSASSSSSAPPNAVGLPEGHPVADGSDGVASGDGKAPDLTRARYWAEGESRGFFATAIDLGYLYFRPRAILGYGRPFWTWVGVEANPQVSSRLLGGYAGLHAALPFVDVRAGSRYIFGLPQSYLAPRDSYGRLEFQSRDLPRSTYVTLEAEIDGKIPAGPGSILLVGTVERVSGVPKGDYVYEETLRVILKPPYVWRARVGYGIRLGAAGRLGVGIVGEILHVPGRNTSVVRGGLIATAALSNHLEVIGSFIPPLASPDTLGIAGGDFAQLGIRFRWATGSPYEPIIVPVVF